MLGAFSLQLVPHGSILSASCRIANISCQTFHFGYVVLFRKMVWDIFLAEVTETESESELELELETGTPLAYQRGWLCRYIKRLIITACVSG